MTTKRLVIGVDGGGTKTRAAILRIGGRIYGGLPSAVAGPSNLASLSAENASDAIVTACRGALEAGNHDAADVVAIRVGASGYSHEANREAVARLILDAFPYVAVTIVPDYLAAFDGALAGNEGVVVIAGTGQIAFGRNGTGREMRTGGYGHLIDDAGSGYGVGRRAVAATLACRDRSGPQTILADLVMWDLAASSLSDIIAGVHGGAIDRARIASLAPLVSDAAGAGDAVAIAILTEAGRHLAGLAASISTRLWPLGSAVDVARVGGLWSAHQTLTASFDAALAHAAPGSRSVAARNDPAVGAAMAARWAIGEARDGDD